MNNTSDNLFDNAVGDGLRVPGGGRFILIEDCVETSGAFVLHHLTKRALLSDDDTVLLLAFSHPFAHYDRVLRKLGCNLSAKLDKNNLHFINLMQQEFKMRGQKIEDDLLLRLFEKIQQAIETSLSVTNNVGSVTILIDDLSLLEIALRGSVNQVLDFLHYCSTLIPSMDCSIIILNHMDIYSSKEAPRLLSHLEYLADTIIKAEPLSTGLAADVHGQLTIITKGNSRKYLSTKRMMHNFHYRVKDNNVDYFYPGTTV